MSKSVTKFDTSDVDKFNTVSLLLYLRSTVVVPFEYLAKLTLSPKTLPAFETKPCSLFLSL